MERGETVLGHDEHEDGHDAEDAEDEGEAAEPPAAAWNAAEHDDGEEPDGGHGAGEEEPWGLAGTGGDVVP